MNVSGACARPARVCGGPASQVLQMVSMVTVLAPPVMRMS